MRLENDRQYRDLSNVTIGKVYNCFKNCDSNDISAHLLAVFFDASHRGEIDNNDVFRLAFKALSDFKATQVD